MISIIIPVYNAEKTISKCLDSILSNDFDDYEIIAVNDGSRDDSLLILRDYEERYPKKIRVYDQRNQGVAKTRDNGVENSRGEFVMFIDNDDWIEEDYLQKFVEEIEKGKMDVVIGGYKRVTAYKTLFEIRLKDVLWSRYMIMAPWAKIYRKDFIQKNDLHFLNNIGEDVYFNLQVINLTDNISIIDYAGYNWFYNEKSVSNTIKKTSCIKFNVLFLLDSCYDKLQKIGVTQKEEVRFYFIRYIVWYLLFIGRSLTYGQFYLEFEKVFSWLQNKFPGFYKNRNISLFLPEGETVKNRIIVYIFMLIYKHGLSKAFLRIYSLF